MARAIGMPDFAKADKDKAAAKGGKTLPPWLQPKGKTEAKPDDKKAVAKKADAKKKAVGVGESYIKKAGANRGKKGKVGVGQAMPMPSQGQMPYTGPDGSDGMPVPPPAGGPVPAMGPGGSQGAPMPMPAGRPMPSIGRGQSVGVGQSTGTTAMAAEVKPSYSRKKVVPKTIGKGASSTKAR